jgi:hypothetical protein
MDNKTIQKKQSVELPTNYVFKDGIQELNAMDTDSALRLQSVKTYSYDKQLEIGDYYLKMPIEVYKDKNVEKESNVIIPNQSWIGGRSINPYSENNSSVQRILDISATFVWNPNSAQNTVMEGLPKGGVSTRY